MNTYFKTMTLMLAGLSLLTACKNELLQTTRIPNGNYSGRFIYDNSTSTFARIHHESKVTVNFNGSSYNSSAGTNYYPAGGSGNYMIANDTTITFNDINIWPSDFDGNLILNRDYTYHYDGDTLVISKQLYGQQFSYQYRIKKN